MLKEQKIKELTLNKLWVAPLAGLTDSAFRTICKRNGADVVMTEMVSADGLVYNAEKSLRYANFEEEHRPIGIQIFGNNPEMMERGADILLALQADFLDINMGCPVKKVVNRGAGSALMKTPKIAFEIVSKLKKNLTLKDTILTAKIRSGWDANSINAVEFSKGLEGSGVDIIIVHPRTRSQMFTGKSDWSIIEKVKNAVNIPVVGNGDITSFDDAKKMKEQTGCDSLMIGRGACGNPWIFNEIKNGLSINLPLKLRTIILHLELLKKNKGEAVAVSEIKSHFAYYSKGSRGGSKIRNTINKSKDYLEILNIIRTSFKIDFTDNT